MLIYYSKKVEECQTKYHDFVKIFYTSYAKIIILTIILIITHYS